MAPQTPQRSDASRQPGDPRRSPSRVDLSGIRARLAGQHGPAFWRTLDEIADTEEVRKLVEDEFPTHASTWPESVSRRRFLSLMGASLALGGLAACTTPPGEKLVAYVRQPEQLLPGQPLFFATGMTLGGFAAGLLVESHTGRPTKVEGNPDHPASLGAADPFSQASILGLYDPDRAQTPTRRGEIRQFDAFVVELRSALAGLPRGRGARILTTTVTSPTLAAQLTQAIEAFPEAQWHEWEPLGPSETALLGARVAFREDVAVRYRFDRAERILALDADFLACEPKNLRYIADVSARRRVGPDDPQMSRLYVVEASRSVTGSNADNRLAMRATDIAAFTTALAHRLGVDTGALRRDLPRDRERWVEAVARDLEAHRGTSVVVPGDAQPALVHALAHAINARLDAAGRTVVYTEPVVARPVDQLASLRALVEDMRAGRVQTLLMIGGNPVYTAPADFDFASALRHVPLSAHLSHDADETSALSMWNIPRTHYLESWGDARAWDGTVTLVQPLIAPLFQAYSDHEVMAVFSDRPLRRGYEIVREHWRGRHGGDDFERFWRESLHRGLVRGTEAPVRRVSVRADLGRALAKVEPPPAPERGFEIVFRPDPTIHDGSFANNAWLQELPKPLTKLTWDNAVLVGPAMAERLGLSDEDVVTLTYRGRALDGPVLIVPGHADGSVTVHLGYGRRLAGRVGAALGYDAYRLRTSTAPWFDTGLDLGRTGRTYRLARTQAHHRMHGRDHVLETTLADYRRDPLHPLPHRHEAAGPPPSLYPEYPYPTYAWGMAIDLAACTGCNACVVACYAENNIPVVGKEQVLMAREMAWLRVDTYYKGDVDDPETFHQPVPCMQCEKAPCEPVCPVMATVHSAEGLNDMVYNRCIGTRYCSNNCPYKVRRFNFLQYSEWESPLAKLLHNPDVTVRSRGVMEKCTYCVQRINAARAQAETEGRRVRDGEVLTACQATCPANAIVFGDLNDPSSRVRQWKQLPRNYALLAELGTQPRTTYLAAVRNPNPELRRPERSG